MEHLECPICLLPSPDFTTKCGHSFHSLCIHKWLLIKPTCPICRLCTTNLFPHSFCLSFLKNGYIKVSKMFIEVSYKFKTNKLIALRRIQYILVNKNAIRFFYDNRHNLILFTKQGNLILSVIKNFW